MIFILYDIAPTLLCYETQSFKDFLPIVGPWVQWVSLHSKVGACSVVVSALAYHAEGPGSNPAGDSLGFFCRPPVNPAVLGTRL